MAARKFPSGIDLVSQKAINVADGTANSDAATWGQVLALLQGLAWKDDVRAASTATVTVASAPAAIDGVTLANGDRVLLKDQTAGAENGIYVFTAAASPLTRAGDADTAAKLKAATVVVAEGTTNADKQYTMNTDNVTLGTTTLTFVPSGGASYTADATGGLQLVGSAFSVKLPASSGLIKDATGLYIDPAIVMRRYAQDFGDGSTTALVITHNLGTKDVHVTVYDKTSNAEEEPDVVHTSTNTITLNYAVAPTTNAKRVVVIG